MSGNHNVLATTLTVTDNVGATTTVTNGGLTNDSTLTFSGIATTGGTGTGPGVDIWVSTDGGLTATMLNVAPVSVPAGGGAWTFTAPALALDGSYTYYVLDTGTAWALGSAVPLNGGPGVSFAATLDTHAPSAPSAPGIAENSAGGINITEAANGTVVNVSVAGTGAVAGDTLHVNWGSQTVDYVLSAGDISGGANVTIGSSVIGQQGNGTFNVTTSITDAAGNSGANSSATSVTVDTVAPSLTTTGSTTGGPNSNVVTLSGTVSDAHGLSSIEVYEGVTLLGSATVNAGNWSFTTLALANGSHSFTATATDLAGNTTNSNTTLSITATGSITATTFAVNDDVNAGNLDTPVTDGGHTNDNLLEFSGVATLVPGATSPNLNIWVDSGSGPTLLANVSVDDVTGIWNFAPSSEASDGFYSYYVTDGSVGIWDPDLAVPLNPGPQNDGKQPFEFELDTQAPIQPTITSVDDGALTLAGIAEPNSTVQIFDGAVLLTTTELLDLTTGPIIADGTDGHWQYTFPASALSAGNYAFIVTATDEAGNTSVQSDAWPTHIHPTVTAATMTAEDNVGTVGGDPLVPSEILTSGDSTNDSTLTFTGTATVEGPAGTASVKIWMGIVGDSSDPTLLGEATVLANGEWTFVAPEQTDNLYAYYVTDGARSHWDPAKAVPLNDAGDSFTLQLDTSVPVQPSIVSVTDDFGAAQYEIGTPPNTDDHTLTLRGFADPGSTVQIFDGPDLLTDEVMLADIGGVIFTDGDTGAWEYTFPEAALAAGTYHFNVKAVDEAGNVSVASSNFDVNIQDNPNAVCFLKGTRVQTPHGEVAVEDLQIGDLVTTGSGQEQAIKWIGRRSYVTRFVTGLGRGNVLPVRIARGALEDNVPHRDLLVSPEHAMCLEGALIPVRYLVNGRSIAYCESLEAIEYYHIELPRHDLLIAEGAATESWLDCGNRSFFMNVVEYAALGLPDQSPTEPCLPFIKDGPVLERVRTKLLARAAALDETTIGLRLAA